MRSRPLAYRFKQRKDNINYLYMCWVCLPVTYSHFVFSFSRFTRATDSRSAHHQGVVAGARRPCPATGNYVAADAGDAVRSKRGQFRPLHAESGLPVPTPAAASTAAAAADTTAPGISDHLSGPRLRQQRPEQQQQCRRGGRQCGASDRRDPAYRPGHSPQRRHHAGPPDSGKAVLGPWRW